MHVLADRPLVNGLVTLPSFDEEILLNAISEGHCFIAFDLFGDTTGFRFTAHDADEKKIMGDEIKLEDQVSLNVNVPVPARIVLLKGGVSIQEASGVNRMDFLAKEKGIYRVEVYLPQLPKPVGDQPWIISNTNNKVLSTSVAQTRQRPTGLIVWPSGARNRKAPDSNYRRKWCLSSPGYCREPQYWTLLSPDPPSIRGRRVQPSLFCFQVRSV
jgi:hypothetical protein